MSVYYYKLPHSAKLNKGFTLLELLIAVSLTAILMTVLVVGINLITRDWEKHNKHLDQKLDESLLLLQIEKAILGTFPYKFKENSLAKEEMFFNGTQTELSWVSTVSPNRTAGLMIWHVKLHDQGGISVNTLPAYPGSLNTQLEQYYLQHPDSSVYLKDYKVSFYYLSENTKKKKQWFRTWDAKDNDSLPLGVRIVFNNRDEQEETSHLNSYQVFAFIRTQKRQASSAFGGGSLERTGLLRPRD